MPLQHHTADTEKCVILSRCCQEFFETCCRRVPNRVKTTLVRSTSRQFFHLSLEHASAAAAPYIEVQTADFLNGARAKAATVCATRRHAIVMNTKGVLNGYDILLENGMLLVDRTCRNVMNASESHTRTEPPLASTTSDAPISGVNTTHMETIPTQAIAAHSSSAHHTIRVHRWDEMECPSPRSTIGHTQHPTRKSPVSRSSNAKSRRI